jgi:hypothetical protein
MPTIHWGSLIVGLLLGILLYHFSKGRVGAGA